MFCARPLLGYLARSQHRVWNVLGAQNYFLSTQMNKYIPLILTVSLHLRKTTAKGKVIECIENKILLFTLKCESPPLKTENS